MKFPSLTIAPILLVSLFGCVTAAPQGGTSSSTHAYKVIRTQDEWRRQLGPAAFQVLRNAGTERPYSGKYWDNHAAGTYVCAGCDQELFSSRTKFESGTGWPSFYQPLAKKDVVEIVDRTLGIVRTEVLCSRCGGHLGHVFEDGPKPTGLRYCMNSVSMKFIPDKKK